MATNAYVRLGPQSPRTYSPVSGWPPTVTMIDVVGGWSAKDIAGSLENLYPGFVTNASVAVVRLPSSYGEDDRQAIASVLQESAQGVPVCFLRQQVGEPATLSGDQIPSRLGIAGTLSRARAIEVLALMEWGNAVRTAQDAHYLLPSGKHSSIFVRTGSAVTSPHDADVLATWLYPFARNGLSIVCDTGTLTSVLLAFRNAMEKAGLVPGPNAVLDHYPDSLLPVRSAVTLVSKDPNVGPMMALLSVSSSGTTSQRVHEALESSPRECLSVQVMVSRGRSQGINRHPHPGNELPDAWLTPFELPDLESSSASEDACELCKDPNRGTLIPVERSTYEIQLPSQQRRLVPSVAQASESRDLWEWADTNGAVQLKTRPRSLKIAIDDDRSGRAYLKIDSSKFDDALAHQAGLKLAEKVVISYRETRRKSSSQAKKLIESMANIDLAITSRQDRKDFEGRRQASDAEMRGFVNTAVSSLKDRLKETFGDEEIEFRKNPIELAEYDDADSHAQWENSTRAKDLVVEAQHPIVFSLDPKTGLRIQRLLFAAQAADNSSRAHIPALVIHARPTSIDGWRVVQNSFENMIFAAWTTYLPYNAAPLQDEYQVLSDYVSKSVIRPPYGEFVKDRMEICQVPDSINAGTPFFWGSTFQDRLTSHALPGDRIHSLATFAAVGSAMQRARVEAELNRRPGAIRFDMARMFSSYYDCLILCSFLRWLRRGEQWWGSDKTATDAFSNALSRMDSSDGELSRYQGILIAEGLLAAAQGKMSLVLAEHLWSKASLAITRLADDLGDDPGNLIPTLRFASRLAEDMMISREQ